MDKRVFVTKKALKDTFLEMLKTENFDSITVTQLCRSSSVSRNTFYHHYVDKYELLEDCFRDYESNFEKHLEELQKKSNPGREIQKTFENIADTYFDMQSNYESISLLSSFDLMELYYHSFMNILERQEYAHDAAMNPGYDLKQLNSFFVLGFWGFIHGNVKLNSQEIRKNTRMLVDDLLDSALFIPSDRKCAHN